MKFWPACVALAIGGACLVACDPARPAGAFSPAYPEEGQDDGFAKKTDASAHVAPDQTAGKTPDATPDDTGSSDTSDTSDTSEQGGSSSSSADAASPVDVMPVGGPSAGLKGSYLVRMDNYSSASATKDGTTLLVHNRLSNLFVVTLTPQEDGTVLSHEVLCDQTYWNYCDTGCTKHDAWTTSLDSRVAKFFAGRAFDRTYTVDTAGKLVAPLSAMALGFEAGEGGRVDVGAPLPTSKSDSHVWHLNPSDSANPSGVRTEFTINSLASAPPLTLTQAVDCIVSSVQIYATTFSGQVDLKAKDPLDGKSFVLDTSGSQGLSLEVTAKGVGSNTYCTKANVDGATPADEKSWIRFKRRALGEVNCPADFESKFPGSTVSTE